MGAGLGTQHQQHLDEQVGQLVAQDPGQLHPVLVGHLVALDARAGVSGAAQRGLGDDLAVVLDRVEQARAGKGLDAAPLFGEVVGQRLAASFEVTDGREELDGVGVLAEDHRVHHAAQVGAGQVLVLLLDDHGARKLRGRDQQVDDRILRVVVLADHGQDVLGLQLLQHHHQGSIAFGVGQVGQRGLGAGDVAGGNQAAGLFDQGYLVHVDRSEGEAGAGRLIPCGRSPARPASRRRPLR